MCVGVWCGVVVAWWVLCCVQVWRIFKAGWSLFKSGWRLFTSGWKVFNVGSLCGSVWLSATASRILELERVASAQTSVTQ